MESELEALTPEVSLQPPYPPEELEPIMADFVAHVGPIPHQDYLNLLRRHAGGSGPVGDRGYLVLWALDEVISANEDACNEEFAPGLLLFAGGWRG